MQQLWSYSEACVDGFYRQSNTEDAASPSSMIPLGLTEIMGITEEDKDEEE